jgi:hypothetical protein
LKSLAILPANIAANLSIQHAIEIRLKHSITGSFEPAETIAEERRQTEIERFRREKVKVNGLSMHKAADWYDQLTDHGCSGPVRDGCTAFFYSVTIWANTVAESTATDLWLDVVNARPRSLAANVINNPSTKQGKQDAVISLKELIEGDLNLNNRLGTILRDRERVKFQSFASIKAAYSDAFRIVEDKKARPSNELIELFAEFENDLRELEATRNLIAHRGGRIDNKYISEMEAIGGSLKNVHEGAVLALNGDDVLRYANAVKHFTCKLLSFVDRWLVSHPD